MGKDTVVKLYLCHMAGETTLHSFETVLSLFGNTCVSSFDAEGCLYTDCEGGIRIDYAYKNRQIRVVIGKGGPKYDYIYWQEDTTDSDSKEVKHGIVPYMESQVVDWLLWMKKVKEVKEVNGRIALKEEGKIKCEEQSRNELNI